MESFIRDLRYGIRFLLANRGFSAVVILALAVGIGANAAIFSVVNSIILRPLPYSDPDRVVMIWMDNRRMGIPEDIHSYPNYVDYRDQNGSFESVAAYSGISVNLVGAGEPERVIGAMATANLFEVLGVKPVLGRTFTTEEEQMGKHQVVVIGNGLWQRRFGANPDVIGQTVLLSDVSRTVIGVMPQGFKFPHQDAELWIPMALNEQVRGARGSFSFFAIGRLKPGVRLEQAKADMGAIAERLQQQYPDVLEGYGVNLMPLHQQVVGNVKPALLALLGAVGFVLLIACANVANLLLARAAVREREIAIRLAIGASRRRIVRQLLTESLLLALAGGALGVLLAVWGLDLLVSMSPRDIPRIDEIRIDRAVLGFTLGVSVLTALLFGLFPAWQSSRPDLNDSLKEGGRDSRSGARGRRIRSALVVAEIALSLVLLVGAGLMVRSFMRVQDLNLGFKPDHLLTMNLQLSRSRYQGRLSQAFFSELIQRVERLPGVESAGAITAVFIPGLASSSNFSIEGRPPAPPSEQVEAPIDFVTPGYFRTMGIPLLSGRGFTEQDGPDQPQVVIINNTFARLFWPNEDPLGKRLKFGGPDSEAPWLTIVGIVGDMRRTGLDAAVRCETFLPYTQRSFAGFMTLVTRTTSDPSKLAAAVRDEIRAIDPNQTISHVTTVDRLLDEMIAQRRLNTILFGIFAAVAMILAAVGIYGVVSYSVTQRNHEIGVRMALGANRRDVLRLVMGHGAILTSFGIAIGLIGAWLITRVMSSLLFEVSATDPMTFAVIAGLLAIVSLGASGVPARRAARVDPLAALRHE